MSKLRRLSLVLVAALVVAAGAGVWVYLHEGTQAYAVQTGSMTPTYRPGDLVLDEPVTPGQLRVGDVITFQHGPELVTHRIQRITPQGVIQTKGDANRSADTWDLRGEEVHGRVVHSVEYGGYVLVFLQQRQAIGGVMLAGVSMLLLYGLFFPGAGAGATGDRRQRGQGIASPALDPA